MQSTYNPSHHPLRDSTQGISATRIHGTVADFAILFALLVVCSMILLNTGWQLGHQMRIYTGVRVASVPIGGLTRADAIEKLIQEVPPHALLSLQLTWADRRWLVPPEQLWHTVEWQTVVNQAYLLGRRGDFATRLVEQLIIVPWQAPKISVELVLLWHFKINLPTLLC